MIQLTVTFSEEILRHIEALRQRGIPIRLELRLPEPTLEDIEAAHLLNQELEDHG